MKDLTPRLHLQPIEVVVTARNGAVDAAGFLQLCDVAVAVVLVGDAGDFARLDPELRHRPCVLLARPDPNLPADPVALHPGCPSPHYNAYVDKK